MMDEFRPYFPELPLVCTTIAVDLVERGLVQSYVHPGGMLTGNVMNAVGGEETMAQKRIGFFKELVPDLRRIGMIAPANGRLTMKEKEALLDPERTSFRCPVAANRAERTRRTVAAG
jgi:putative ABC transport system substrate-binding protein